MDPIDPDPTHCYLGSNNNIIEYIYIRMNLCEETGSILSSLLSWSSRPTLTNSRLIKLEIQPDKLIYEILNDPPSNKCH